MRPILLAPARPLHKESKDHAASREVLKFFDWAYKNGDEMAEELDYQRRRSRSQGVGQDQGQGRQTHFGRGLKVCHCMVSYVRS